MVIINLTQQDVQTISYYILKTRRPIVQQGADGKKNPTT